MTPREYYVHGYRVARLAARHGASLRTASDICPDATVRLAATRFAPLLRGRPHADPYEAERTMTHERRHTRAARRALITAARQGAARAPGYRAAFTAALRDALATAGPAARPVIGFQREPRIYGY